MNSNIYYIIHSTSFGDTLASTPTLRYLSKSHRQKINIVTHRKDVFINNPYVRNVLSFDEYFSLNLSNIIKYESHTFAGQRDGNGIEKKFSHMDVRQIHAIDLGFQLPNEDLVVTFIVKIEDVTTKVLEGTAALATELILEPKSNAIMDSFVTLFS